MKIKTKTIYHGFRLQAAIFSFLLLFSVDAFANSAIMKSEGVSSGGAILTTDCPLTVLHEDLSFDITGFADDFSVMENETCTGTVTAEYNLLNEADTEVRAELAFAAGYFGGSQFADAENPVLILCNGEELPYRTRVTYVENYGGEPDVRKLSDELSEDPFFFPDMPVYVERYTVSGNGNFNPAVFGGWECLWIPSAEKGPVFPVGENETLTVYSFGEGNTLSLEVEDFGTAETGEVTDLFSVIMKMEDRPSDISDTDWYNAVIDAWNRNAVSFGEGKVLCGPVLRDSEGRLIRWYEYSLTAGPGETFVNTVTVPLYPELFGSTSSKSVDNYYTYLLSPARSFHRFGTLSVTIRSPYKPTLQNRTEELEKDGDYYKVSFDTLPDGELEFGVTVKKTTEKKSASPGILGGILAVILSLVLSVLKWVLIAAALSVLVVLIVKRIRKKK